MRLSIIFFALLGILAGCSSVPYGTKGNPKLLVFENVDYKPEGVPAIFSAYREAAENCWAGPNGKFTEYVANNKKTNITERGNLEITFDYRDQPNKEALTIKVFRETRIIQGWGPEVNGPLGKYVKNVGGHLGNLCGV